MNLTIQEIIFRIKIEAGIMIVRFWQQKDLTPFAK